MISYEVKSIDYQDCKEWFLKKHYLKRIPLVQFAFGLFDKDRIVGVCSYGTTLASDIRKQFNYNVYELNRLVVNEGLPKNALSFFVGQTIQMMPKPCVLLSYADTSKGHHGYIYQATNWIYTGLSAIRKDYKVKGEENIHSQTLFDKSRGKENRVGYLKQIYGDRLYMASRDRKHRYFYFLGYKRDKKKMIKELPYQIQPYPKGENKRYDASYQPTTQIKLL